MGENASENPAARMRVQTGYSQTGRMIEIFFLQESDLPAIRQCSQRKEIRRERLAPINNDLSQAELSCLSDEVHVVASAG